MFKLPILDPRAAFVDVGSEQMHVSIAGGPPEVFGTVTSQLHALRDWLIAQGVRSVAMEATGVYWLPLYGVLESAGLQVVMVNGRQTRNLPGRKTDMKDCQWGATLHAHGLLRAGFVPPSYIRQLQDYMRLRDDHITMAASHVQHMQKALERMNVKLHDAISSLTGVSGLAVVRAILAGERDPGRLLALCDIQIQRKKAERVKESLRGTWADEHLFALAQALQSWEHYQGQIAACDERIAVLLSDSGGDGETGERVAIRGPRKGASENAPKIPHLRQMVTRLCGGKDLAVLPAHTEYGVLRLVAEVGTDLSKWKTEKHFTSWAGLAPGSDQSGKRRRSRRRQRNRVGRMFCVMARSLARSKDIALGGYYRRMAARRGASVANVALARKLAVLFWRVMVKGLDFVEHGLANYEVKVLQTKQRALQRLAKQLGQQVVPLPQPA
ncbi:IS110 family transposase [Ramlibacter sp. 2FC]|uniref:IS110 family transposase n=1 Tax=Ramlibacter sp. 2FC TaxID=2502188 RepID=UPI001484EB23|nr:IS110 family transposase [Ramlibacter sp. 2FC]